MESTSWPESLQTNRIKAINELTKGQNLRNKLGEMIGRPEKIESDLKLVNDVTLQILGMFDNTLSILQSSDPNEIPHYPTNDVRSQSSWNDQKTKDFAENNKNMKSQKTKRRCYIRRKNASTITKVVSTLIDDGYAWRKYGQKTILNSKHQRNYYRCSHKLEQGCQATKQVQKTNDKPSKYMITYDGFHTCNNLQSATQVIFEAPNPKDSSILINFETNTLMENHKFDSCFQSMKGVHKNDFPSLSLKQEQVFSLDHHTPWDSIVGLSHVPLEPMLMMSHGFNCENMVVPPLFSSTCSTYDFEFDDIIESYDYGDFLFELYR
ncbi:putative WRKY transcription factor 70 [Bidens hawaiensis]|uniref:putative WRKY transcription factor 70 n=1 Tax=Bidens hawaiensis TaxID=980011 RepID=UPI00404B55F5